jgi:anionic cell wall polymer biosynthesis LytR-Cps2A-Psr (LCP) family protein
MSEEKNISGTPSGDMPKDSAGNINPPENNEPALTDLISSAMKKVEENKKQQMSESISMAQAAQKAQTVKQSDRPELSFKKDSAPQPVKKTAVKANSATDAKKTADTDKKNTSATEKTAKNTSAEKKPTQTAEKAKTDDSSAKGKESADNGANAKKKTNGTNGKKTKNANNSANAKNTGGSSGAKGAKKGTSAKGAVASGGEVKSAGKAVTAGVVADTAAKSATEKKSVADAVANTITGIFSKKELKDAAAKAGGTAQDTANTDTDANAVSADGTVANTPVWKKFTKKQLATVAGLIGSLLLVLVLIIYLIFSYYYGKLGKADSVYNTSAMTYSDTDLSAADTIDKETEEAKLKELLAMGEKISNKDVMNILLIAEDLRDDSDEDAAGNTDVMMIISVNTKDKTITMTSIMRDCYVYIPNWYSTRINAAYWHGGVELTQETIESYMNVQIDRYVLVNFTSFIDIVDAVGGIDMYVSDEEANGYEGADPNGDNTRGMQNPLDEQNDILGNPAGTDYISEGGDLHLNGNQALAYARLRHVGNADYERTERQRKVIAEMIKQSRNMSIVQLDKLLNKVLPEIKTDITKTEAAQLLVDMLDYRNYDIQEMRVPADGTFTNERIDGNDVLVVDFEQNSQLFRELVYGSIEIDEDGVEEDMKIE